MPKFVICWTEAVNHAVEVDAETEGEAIAEWEGTYYDPAQTAQDSAMIDDMIRIIDEDGEMKEVYEW